MKGGLTKTTKFWLAENIFASKKETIWEISKQDLIRPSRVEKSCQILNRYVRVAIKIVFKV